jgi:hypothetical protein
MDFSDESDLTDFCINPNGVRKWPMTAHLPGAVEGRVCGECGNFDPCSVKLKGWCRLAFEFRGEWWRFAVSGEDGKRGKGWWRGAPTISAETAACKFFLKKVSAEDVSEDANAGESVTAGELA